MNLLKSIGSRFRRRSASVVDPTFYGRYYLDLREHDTGALLLHYENHGRQEGRHPSLEALRRALATSGKVLPKDFDPQGYIRLNQDIKGLDENWQIELHYLDKGMQEGRRYKPTLEDIADEAIELREKGDFAAAAKLNEWLCEAHPEIPYGWRESAALHKLVGDKANALLCLERALELDNSVLSATQLARHKGGMGFPAEARKHLASCEAWSPCDKAALKVHDQLLQFMIDYPRERAQKMLKDITDTPQFLDDEAAIEDLIMTALAKAKPFSLIRLGDGEGAWLTDVAEEGRKYAELYQRNRHEILHTWFGSDALVERPDFLALVPRLKAAVAGATVVGIPYPQRIEWEYDVASLDGIPSCMMVMRYATAMAADPARLFTSHDAHFNLQLSGALDRLLKLRCRVGLICCHPGLAMRLYEKYGVEIVANLCLPEEKRMAEIIGANGSRLAHFPDVFERNLVRIRANDWTSTVWLVAAGFLGKIYCDEVRLNGGIAIDIGSLADGWMGKKTRPTLEKEIWSYELVPSEARLSA